MIHIVLFKIKPGAEAAAVERLITEAKAKLTQIPVVENLTAGWVLQKDSPYRVGLSMRLKDDAALQVYRTHPLHVDYVENVIKPVEESRLVLDVEE